MLLSIVCVCCRLIDTEGAGYVTAEQMEVFTDDITVASIVFPKLEDSWWFIRPERCFLTAMYTEDMYYFELLEFFKKAFMTGALMYVGQGTSSETAFVACVFIFAINALALSLKPFKTVRYANVMAVSNSALFMQVLLILLLNSKDLHLMSQNIQYTIVGAMKFFIGVLVCAKVLVDGSTWCYGTTPPPPPCRSILAYRSCTVFAHT